MSTAIAVGSPGFARRAPRYAKPVKEPLPEIDPLDVLRWSLEWPFVSVFDRAEYVPVIGRWRVRVA